MMSGSGSVKTPARQQQLIADRHVIGQTQSPSPLTPLLKEEIKRTILSRRSAQELAEITSHTGHSTPTQLTPEEEERRRARREKNRVAAAKCRDRQRDRADSLFRETQQLEAQNNSLRQEIRKLTDEKSQLSFALNIHQLQSSVGNHPCKLLMASGRHANGQRTERGPFLPPSSTAAQGVSLWSAHSQQPAELAGGSDPS